ncbi:hypothetical protein DFH06DRAFT_1186681 [Mycena polygramma]|nr:hypothetical protein DFH06DRAFT_1186681 [Mycena polygramma]
MFSVRSTVWAVAPCTVWCLQPEAGMLCPPERCCRAPVNKRLHRPSRMGCCELTRLAGTRNKQMWSIFYTIIQPSDSGPHGLPSVCNPIFSPAISLPFLSLHHNPFEFLLVACAAWCLARPLLPLAGHIRNPQTKTTALSLFTHAHCKSIPCGCGPSR